MTTPTLTTECNTCPACQTRREVPQPVELLGYGPETNAWWDAQDAATELDCHCDHTTCGSLSYDHDEDECEWCQYRHDPDEDASRNR
jgi:hypothetical protein